MMKKTIFASILIITIFAAGIFAQTPPAANSDVDEFDHRVSSMPSIPRPLASANIDVVGLEIAQGTAEASQLSRIAQAGSGNYFPVANALDLNRIFTRVTTGIGGGGGGGRMTRGPSTVNWPIVLSLFFILGSMILTLAMILIKRRGVDTGHRLKAHALLDITYPNGEAKRVLMTGTTSIGRGNHNALIFPDDRVSNNHAVIAVNPEGFLIRDLGSTNGTYVNGKRITEQWLYIGDSIQIGSSVMRFGA